MLKMASTRHLMWVSCWLIKKRNEKKKKWISHCTFDFVFLLLLHLAHLYNWYYALPCLIWCNLILNKFNDLSIYVGIIFQSQKVKENTVNHHGIASYRWKREFFPLCRNLPLNLADLKKIKNKIKIAGFQCHNCSSLSLYIYFCVCARA